MNKSGNSRISTSIKDTMHKIMNINTDFVVFILGSAIVLLIILITVYYIYMKKLPNRECNAMDTIFSTLN